MSRYNEDLRAIEARVRSDLMASEYIVLNTDGHGIQMRNRESTVAKARNRENDQISIQLSQSPDVGP